jgi:hypothetical protein
MHDGGAQAGISLFGPTDALRDHTFQDPFLCSAMAFAGIGETMLPFVVDLQGQP